MNQPFPRNETGAPPFGRTPAKPLDTRREGTDRVTGGSMGNRPIADRIAGRGTGGGTFVVDDSVMEGAR